MSLLAKVDIEHAYRNIPIHPQDRHLLGMRWNNILYIDTVLPFGLRSAPKLFNAIADTLEWILLSRGVTHLHHYLDDVLTMGPKESDECESNLTTKHQYLVQHVRRSSQVDKSRRSSNITCIFRNIVAYKYHGNSLTTR